MDALLLMVPLARANNHVGQGDFRLAPDGRITGWRTPGKPAPFVYTGVQIVSRRLFQDAPDGSFSLNLLWNRAIAQQRVYGLVHEGLWFDVGTPPAIAKTEAILGLT
jgi:MurNAc alpha-1-phosphate uridylyltransferase